MLLFDFLFSFYRFFPNLLTERGKSVAGKLSSAVCLPIHLLFSLSCYSLLGARDEFLASSANEGSTQDLLSRPHHIAGTDDTALQVSPIPDIGAGK